MKRTEFNEIKEEIWNHPKKFSGDKYKTSIAIEHVLNLLEEYVE